MSASQSSPRARKRARRRTQGGRRRLGRSRHTDRGGFPGLRRRDRDPRPDGCRREARPRARPAWPDAEPEDRTVTFDIGKAVSTRRPASWSTAPTAAEMSICRLGRRVSRSEPCSRTTPRSWRRSSGRSRLLKGRYITKITLTTTMGPSIHVDSTKTRASSRSSRKLQSRLNQTNPPKTAGSRGTPQAAFSRGRFPEGVLA